MKRLLTRGVGFRPCVSDTWPFVLWMSEQKLTPHNNTYWYFILLIACRCFKCTCPFLLFCEFHGMSWQMLLPTVISSVSVHSLYLKAELRKSVRFWSIKTWLASLTPQPKGAVKCNPVLMKEAMCNTPDIVKAVGSYLLVSGEGDEG